METYRTSNSEYGRPWVIFNGDYQFKLTSKVSPYRAIAYSPQSLRTKLTLLKTKVMLEKEIEDLEINQPPNYTYDPCIPEPSKTQYSYNPENMIYPTSCLKSHPIYVTSNSDYGRIHPSINDLPIRYYPRNSKFTSAFIRNPEIDP